MDDARKICGTALAIAVPLMWSSAVRAQQAPAAPIGTLAADTNAVDSTSYDRGRNEGVLERQRPDYNAAGVTLGAFTLYPKVTLAQAYDDNVFATQSPTSGDFIFTATPELDLQSNWSRNELAGYVRLEQSVYAHFSGEDTTQYVAGASGKLQLGETTLSGGIDYGEYTLPRAVSNNFGPSDHPIDYGYLSLTSQFSAELTRVRFSLRFDDEDYIYHNGQTATGELVFVEDESHNDASLTGKAELAITPDAAAYLLVSGNNRAYALQPPAVPFSLSSSGYQVQAGANFDLTHLVRGEVQIGYLRQSFVSNAFTTEKGFTGSAQVQWFPTGLTTVTLLVNRSLGDAQVPGSAGYVGSTASARVDHELLRNVILSGDVSYGDIQNLGIDRNDTQIGVGLSANWLLTRHVGVTFTYKYANQRSVGTAAGPSFSDNRGMVSLVLQL